MKKRKFVNAIIIIFISTILLCTYFSKTIKNILLPKVSVVNMKSSSIIYNDSNPQGNVSPAEEGKKYDNIIPKGCLTKEGGLDFIYVLNTNTSALGGNYYVQKVQVQIIASDSTNCAIKAPEGSSIPKNYGIVLTSSKQISNNTEVKLDTES